MTDLNTAVETILDRRPEYEEAEAYYDGTQYEVFASVRLRRLFGRTGDAYKLNFCRTVVDSVVNRMEIASISATTQTAQNKIDAIFQENELALEQDEIHRRALEYGDCYVIAWPDADGTWQIAYNSPKTTTIVYDPENPRKKLYAAKLWAVTDEQNKTTHRLNIYYPDRISKYTLDAAEVSEKAPWNHTSTEENPFGEVPVFHFRTHRPYGRPEHQDAYEPQNGINKLFATAMFTVDYQGAPQRYAISNMATDTESQDFEEGDTDRENIGALRNGPGELWYLKGVTNVGQFNPADPDSFWTPIKNLVRSMASMTNTPLHYFEATGNVPSGEALRTAEAPLLKKVKDRQMSFGAAWRELFLFMLKVDGISGDVEVKWHAVESLDSLDMWDVMLKKINSGLSHRQALREGGYDEDLIEKIMAERENEANAGLVYQRAPKARVSTTDNETLAKEDTTNG